MKIDENRQYSQRKSSKLLDDLSNFNDIFRKDVPYDNIKSHTKPGFHRVKKLRIYFGLFKFSFDFFRREDQINVVYSKQMYFSTRRYLV